MQQYGTIHLGVDNYSTMGKKGPGYGGGQFPVDYGITAGIIRYGQLSVEAGVDLVEPADEPLSMNLKAGIPEEFLFKNSPGVSVGIFNAGFRKYINDYNIINVVFSKTLPLGIGKFHGGLYAGSDTLKDGNGKVEKRGFMLGYERYVYGDKLAVVLDYASGNNVIGGYGTALNWFFSGKASLLIGPVWFNDAILNGPMKWTCQLDINF